MQHVVFITTNLAIGSTIMRAHAVAAGINAVSTESATRGAHAFVALNTNLSTHVATHGPPTVCVLVKHTYNDETSRKICREAGAIILWDLIDLHRTWNLWYLRAVDLDAIITLTQAHRRWLEAHHLPAVYIPHGH